jgi:hypothetical protein
MPPPIQFPERLQVRLTGGTLSVIHAVKRKDEPDAAFVRRAVQREIARATQQKQRAKK